MAQKIQTLLVDDLDGSEAEGTVRFGLDGAEYEIDLNAGHAKELRDVLARYVDAGRRVGGSARKPARGSRRVRPGDAVRGGRPGGAALLALVAGDLGKLLRGTGRQGPRGSRTRPR